jgi:hypothetical protein
LANMTPLYYACKEGYTESVLRLLTLGATTEIYDEAGRGPLHMACQSDYEPTVALLIDYGASMDAVNTVGNTPLHLCGTFNAVLSSQWLLMRGADRTIRNKSGQSAEEAAVLAGNLELGKRIAAFQNSFIGRGVFMPCVRLKSCQDMLISPTPGQWHQTAPPPPRSSTGEKAPGADAILKNLSQNMHLALKPYRDVKNQLTGNADVMAAFPPAVSSPPAASSAISAALGSNSMGSPAPIKPKRPPVMVASSSVENVSDGGDEVPLSASSRMSVGAPAHPTPERQQSQNKLEMALNATMPSASASDSAQVVSPGAGRPKSRIPTHLDKLRMQIILGTPIVEIDGGQLLSELDHVDKILTEVDSPKSP